MKRGKLRSDHIQWCRKVPKSVCVSGGGGGGGGGDTTVMIRYIDSR